VAVLYILWPFCSFCGYSVHFFRFVPKNLATLLTAATRHFRFHFFVFKTKIGQFSNTPDIRRQNKSRVTRFAEFSPLA
jgi:hypothetical protein